MKIAKILLGATVLNLGIEIHETIKFEDYYNFPVNVITNNGKIYLSPDHYHYEIDGIFSKGETTMSLTGDSTGNYYTSITGT
jgi:hypothetical protein